jgi:hypothetical protein
MQTNQKGIITLIVILSVGLLAVSAALTIALNSFAGLFDNRNVKFGDFAFYTSEAAAREGALQFIAGQSISNLSELNDSSSDISVTELDWPYYEIKGSADNIFNSRSNVFTVTTFAEGLAFNYAVFSKTDLKFAGDAEVEGNVFANDGFSFNSPNKTYVYGDAFSPEEIDGTDNNISGDEHEGTEEISPPSIDIDNLKASADVIFDDAGDAKTYINGQTITNEIVVVEDADGATIGNSHTNFTGCLIVLGDLHLSGGYFNQMPSDNYPAIIVEGNLIIGGGTDIKGVVYVTGDTSFGTGGGTIDGSLISAGDVTTAAINGTAKIYYNEEYASIWQEMPGWLEPTQENPRIIDWRQE